jgi:hypothetical protein
VSKVHTRQKRTPVRSRRSFKARLRGLGIRVAVAVILVWMVIALFVYAWALTFDLKTISDMPQRSAVYDKDGKFYSRLAGENRDPRSFRQDFQ